ncbi:MAG: hypothetical protein AAFW00_01785 [Bacteroidota bacterium]
MLKLFAYKLGFLWLMLVTVPAFGQLEQIMDLEGEWAFTIGDDPSWAILDHNHSNWDRIPVPGQWEEHGFPGYDGYAWYRKEINGRKLPQNQDLFIYLGNIDDVDEVYLNGTLIGSTGSLPPDFRTGYGILRVYRLPRDVVEYDGKNVLAVRVYDEFREGGILAGWEFEVEGFELLDAPGKEGHILDKVQKVIGKNKGIGIYGKKKPAYLQMDLTGTWEIAFSDRIDTDYEAIPSDKWHSLWVPKSWEAQGFGHDGYAFYRKTFYCPKEVAEESLMIMVGVIDDQDQVYINGELVGQTGFYVNSGKNPSKNSWSWLVNRAYSIPSGILKPDQQNVIIVKVYDHGGEGGIYKGPVGLIRDQDYTRFMRNRKK